MSLKTNDAPCNKFDMNFYGNSMSFHVTNQRQFGPNPHQIPWLFPIVYPRFIFFHAQTWHGISMTFAKKMMGFSSELVSFPTKLRAKRHEKIRVTFFYREGMKLRTFCEIFFTINFILLSMLGFNYYILMIISNYYKLWVDYM